MKRTVSALEARKRLGELLESVHYRDDEVIIERAGKPMAVVISARRYEAEERRKQAAWDRLRAIVDEIREHNKDVPYEVIQAEVDEAVREVRAERRRKAAAG